MYLLLLFPKMMAQGRKWVFSSSWCYLLQNSWTGLIPGPVTFEEPSTSGRVLMFPMEAHYWAEMNQPLAAPQWPGGSPWLTLLSSDASFWERMPPFFFSFGRSMAQRGHLPLAMPDLKAVPVALIQFSSLTFLGCWDSWDTSRSPPHHINWCRNFPEEEENPVTFQSSISTMKQNPSP